VFSAATVAVEPIREAQEYGGQRVTLEARLGQARIDLQVDVGFGDAITPKAEDVEYPTLLGMNPPHLRAYPRETVVAEKLEALVKLGMVNSRMKDFFDLAILARSFSFVGAVLRAGTDHRNGVSFDQQDGSALGGWTGHDAIGAYARVARHVAKSAESNRARNLAWQSLERTGRPGVRAC
jgi:hypothetical protein